MLEYLARVPTLKRLLGHMFAQKAVNATTRAIDAFSSTEALRNVFSTVLATPELLAIPFEALLRNTPTLRGGD